MSDLRLNRPFRLFAPAKVNLGLEVTGRRPDGYHTIVTLLETVSLFDVIDLRPSTGLQVISDDRIAREDDLCGQALARIQQWKGARLNLAVRILKGIPISAGLGGGSSDAGTLLSAVGTMVGMPHDVMHRIAAELGSDVPFFLEGGTALATGTGTELTAVAAPGRRWYVIVYPDMEIPHKTATLYGRLTSEDFSDGSRTRSLSSEIEQGMNLDSMWRTNAFARVLSDYGDFSRAAEALQVAGASSVMPSGAGPAVFTVCDTFAEASRLAHALPAIAGRRYIATTVQANVNSSRLLQLAPS